MEVEKMIDEVKNCADEVYKILGTGYSESIYEEALGVEFRKRKISYEVQKDVEVLYKGEKVGVHRLDFVVMNKLVVELKIATKIGKSHIKQTVAYLKTLKMHKGLLINFPYPQEDKPEIVIVEV